MNIQDFIDKHNLPTHSRIVAMQQVMDQHGELEPSEYRVRIIELTGRGDDLLDREARYTYLYLIQEMLTMHFRNPDEQINRTVVYNTAERKAIDYIEKNQHLFVEKEEVVKVDANGKVKKKRGAKKDMVCAMWADPANDGLTRQEWIALLMEKVDMTKSGASTYYANLKKGTFGC